MTDKELIAAYRIENIVKPGDRLLIKWYGHMKAVTVLRLHVIEGFIVRGTDEENSFHILPENVIRKVR